MIDSFKKKYIYMFADKLLYTWMRTSVHISSRVGVLRIKGVAKV